MLSKIEQQVIKEILLKREKLDALQKYDSLNTEQLLELLNKDNIKHGSKEEGTKEEGAEKPTIKRRRRKATA